MRTMKDFCDGYAFTLWKIKMYAAISEMRILISAIDILRDIELDSYILKEINDHPECRRTMMICNIYVASASSDAAPHEAEVEEVLSSVLWP
jgi:glutathione synthase/RimK-type ligase-like ATP-grasp enzyme